MKNSADTPFLKLANDGLGGPVDLDKLPVDHHGANWIAQFTRGLQQITSGYEGDRNANDDAYSASTGLFNSSDFNGCADIIDGTYVFGVSLGVPQRLQKANLLLAKGTLTGVEASAVAYILGSQDNLIVPDNAVDIVNDLERNYEHRLRALRLTYFGFAYMWMHEAFHTLIGHVNVLYPDARRILELMNIPPTRSEDDKLKRAGELDADSAAVSNFAISVARTPSFGLGIGVEFTAEERAADVIYACVVVLLASELQRANVGKELRPGLHPVPRLRLVAALGTLEKAEARGILPAKTMDVLRQKVRLLQSSLLVPQVDEFLALAAGHTSPTAEEQEEISELRRYFRASRPELARFKFVDSV